MKFTGWMMYQIRITQHHMAPSNAIRKEGDKFYLAALSQESVISTGINFLISKIELYLPRKSKYFLFPKRKIKLEQNLALNGELQVSPGISHSMTSIPRHHRAPAVSSHWFLTIIFSILFSSSCFVSPPSLSQVRLNTQKRLK